MDFVMTFSASRNYVEPMLRRVPIVMMVLMSWACAKMTQLLRDSLHLLTPNCVVNRGSRLFPFRMVFGAKRIVVSDVCLVTICFLVHGNGSIVSNTTVRGFDVLPVVFLLFLFVLGCFSALLLCILGRFFAFWTFDPSTAGFLTFIGLIVDPRLLTCALLATVMESVWGTFSWAKFYSWFEIFTGRTSLNSVVCHVASF